MADIGTLKQKLIDTVDEALDAADPESKGFAALCTVALGIVKTFHSEIPADTEIPQAIQTAALKFMERPARRGGDA